MSEPRTYKPGEFVIREVGLVKLMDGEEVKGAIIEFPAGPPEHMTWGDVWSGQAFTTARAVVDSELSE